MGAHEPLPLATEIPSQGDWPGPDHGGIAHARDPICGRVGQVHHDHTHPAVKVVISSNQRIR